jgi:hypothetical protein
VYVILRAQQACSQDLIDSVRTALLNLLTDPNTAFGELSHLFPAYKLNTTELDCLGLLSAILDALEAAAQQTWLAADTCTALSFDSACLLHVFSVGAYGPGVVVTVACYNVPAGQVSGCRTGGACTACGLPY